ncbi:MAG: M64 family metallopeptidase [Bacteroidales bacterium]|nr:M64 family metallopeptidase [Bacteroidales bacterium]MDD4217488.1 M64 family metallopeptidase [Bacteroidales bacterium]
MKGIMKLFIKLLLPIVLTNLAIISSAQLKYDVWFTNNSLRIDYYHSGTDKTESIMLKEIRKEEFWGGTKTKLIDPFNYGSYRVNVYDSVSNTLIFTYGFCSLFEEWQFTDEAKILQKGFPESLIIPYPKKNIKIELMSRQFEDNKFKKIFELYINPFDVNIKNEKTVSAEVKKIQYSNTSDKALDLVFIAEGYTLNEKQSFYDDVTKISNYLLNLAPFNKLKNKINIWAVAAISAESGTDKPHKGIWKSTALNSNFNTFGSERYLTSSDYHTIRNYAALAPCDQVCILVNTETYGGGGIYNFWNISSAKNDYINEVFSHELGHSLGALGDEYYTDEVATEDIYNKNTEPYQQNLTTLVNFDSKWKNMLGNDTPIPTPVSDENIGKIGVYEGGGYQAKGIYRPYMNCKMKSLGYDFCPVCQKTLENVIYYYSE